MASAATSAHRLSVLSRAGGPARHPWSGDHTRGFRRGATAVAAYAARLTGVARVLKVEDPSNEHALGAVLAPQVAAIATPYSATGVRERSFRALIAALTSTKQVATLKSSIVIEETKNLSALPVMLSTRE